MYAQVFSRLALNSTTATEFSQAVAMTGANAARVDFVIYSISGTGPTVTATLQESNDLENWSDLSSSTSASVVGYKIATSALTVSAAYTRLKVALTGTGSPIAIVSAGINTALL